MKKTIDKTIMAVCAVCCCMLLWPTVMQAQDTLADYSEPVLEMMYDSPSRLAYNGYAVSDERAAELMGDARYAEYLKWCERYHDGRALLGIETPVIGLLGTACFGIAYFDNSPDGSKMMYLMGAGCWLVATGTLVAGLTMATKGYKRAQKVVQDANASLAAELTVSPMGLTLRF